MRGGLQNKTGNNSTRKKKKTQTMTFLICEINNNESVAKKSRHQIIGKSHENR